MPLLLSSIFDFLHTYWWAVLIVEVVALALASMIRNDERWGEYGGFAILSLFMVSCALSVVAQVAHLSPQDWDVLGLGVDASQKVKELLDGMHVYGFFYDQNPAFGQLDTLFSIFGWFAVVGLITPIIAAAIYYWIRFEIWVENNTQPRTRRNRN